MPPVYSILSFFSYRYFRNYTYWSFGTVVYEVQFSSKSFAVRNLTPITSVAGPCRFLDASTPVHWGLE